MDKYGNKTEFKKPEPPAEYQDTAFDIGSVASATECTGIGHIFPILPDEAEDLTDIYTLNTRGEKGDVDGQKMP